MAETVATSASLAQLVNERPQLIGVFESLRLDYCCGGGQTLAEACESQGLDVETVRQMIDAFERVGVGDVAGAAGSPAGAGRPAGEERDWREAGLGELCDHITAVYHDGLRRDLPELGELIDTVVRVHRAERPELVDAEHAFVDLRRKIEAHIEEEEQTLFPAIRELETLPGTPAVDPAWIEQHESEHIEVGEGLSRLRALADDYDSSKALCSTHRRLYERLDAFESELHQHVHKENNILFPRARDLAAEKAETNGGAGD